jgi:JAB domain-containing protein similar to deubiquitination enzymes
VLKRCLAIGLLLVCGCASAPVGTIVIPTIAYPFDRNVLVRDDVTACTDRVFTLAFRGLGKLERAAFLKLNERGTFDCQLWPPPFAIHRADWFGTTPDRTVAVIHSHPVGSPDPSEHDRQEAIRLGVPMIVVTPEAISMALPRDGAIVRVRRVDGGRQGRRPLTARRSAAAIH